MAALRDDLAALSRQHGEGGEIGQHAAIALIGQNPELNHHQGFAMLYHWLLAGGKTVFLQDANSLIMKTDQLVEVLAYLRRTFPSVERVTTYARSKTLVQKPLDDLKAIRRAGLDRLHVGLESGDDTVLEKIRKGATAEVHIKGGQKALAAGFQLSEYWMPGLGGKALWEQHARNTARVLSEIDPHYIRSRPLRPWPGTPLAREMGRGCLRDADPRGAAERIAPDHAGVVGHRPTRFKTASIMPATTGKIPGGSSCSPTATKAISFRKKKRTVLDLIDDGLTVGRYSFPGFNVN